jgi:hypothetical protein
MHQRFEKDSSCRLDPKKVCEVLELEKGVNYHLETTSETESLWNFSMKISDLNFEEGVEERIKERAIKTFEDTNFRAYVLKYSEEAWFESESPEETIYECLHICVSSKTSLSKIFDLPLSNSELTPGFYCFKQKEKTIEIVPLGPNDRAIELES